jgi:hypothetical protein
MMERLVDRRQPDLLVRAANALEPKPNTTADSGGSDVSASAADGGAPRRRYGASGRGQQ